jgi:hypothetical protein
MKWVLFFLLAFSVSKSIGNNIFFIANRLTDGQKITDDRFSVGDFVGKLITDGMIVQIPTENSVSKSKDCGSVPQWSKILQSILFDNK